MHERDRGKDTADQPQCASGEAAQGNGVDETFEETNGRREGQKACAHVCAHSARCRGRHELATMPLLCMRCYVMWHVLSCRAAAWCDVIRYGATQLQYGVTWRDVILCCGATWHARV